MMGMERLAARCEVWNKERDALVKRGVQRDDQISCDSDGIVFKSTRDRSIGGVSRPCDSYFVRIIIDDVIPPGREVHPQFTIVSNELCRRGLVTFLSDASVREYLTRVERGEPCRAKKVLILQVREKSAFCRVLDWC